MKMKKIALLIVLFFVLSCCKRFLGNFDQPQIIDYFPKSETIARDSSFYVVFNKSMDTQQTAKAFSLSDLSGSAIPGRIEWQNSNTKLVFFPYQLLESNGRYSLSVTGSAEDKDGNDLKVTNYKWSVNYSAVGLQSDRPVLLSYDPADQQIGASVTQIVTLKFNKQISRESISMGISCSFDYIPVWQSSIVNGVSIPDSQILLQPKNPLEYKKLYQITVSEGLKDIAGNKLYEEKKFAFTVGADFIEPSILSVCLRKKTDNFCFSSVFNESLINLIDDQSTRDFNIAVQFSKPLDKNLLASLFSFADPYDLEWDAVTAGLLIVKPRQSLNHGFLYSLEFSQSLKDISGNPLKKPYSFKFRLGTDLTPPAIAQLTLKDGITDQQLVVSQIDQPLNQASTTSGYWETGGSNPRPVIEVVFTKAMDPVTIKNLINVSQTYYIWSMDKKTLTINLNEDLVWHTKYDISFTNKMLALDGNAMLAKQYSFSAGNDYIEPSVSSLSFYTGSGAAKGSNFVYSSAGQTISFVEKSDRIRILFSEGVPITGLREGLQILDANTQSPVAVTITQISGEQEYEIKPLTYFNSSGYYKIRLTDKIKDRQNNSLTVSNRGEYYFKTDAYASRALIVCEGKKIESVDVSGISAMIYYHDGIDWKGWKNQWNEVMGLKKDIDGTTILMNGKLVIHFNNEIDPATIRSIFFGAAMSGTDAAVKLNPWDIDIENNIENLTEAIAGVWGTNLIINRLVFTGSSDLFYKLTINGGISGIKDKNGNYMSENFSFIFRVNRLF